MSEFNRRVCVVCKHFVFDPGCPDWSDVTPGDDWSMQCSVWVDKDGRRTDDQDAQSEVRFCIGGSDTTEAELRAALLTAETCPDFEGEL